MVTVFLLRWTFFFKGLSLIHGLQQGPSRIIAPGSSVLSPESPCIHRIGIWCDPWRTGISVIKNSNLHNFPSRSTRMKNDPYHSWKAPCSFCEATGSPVLRPASSGCETPECTRWLHGRNRVPSRSDTDHFSSVYSGTENKFSPRYAGAPRTMPDACPVYTRWCRRQHRWCSSVFYKSLGIMLSRPEKQSLVTTQNCIHVQACISNCVEKRC